MSKNHFVRPMETTGEVVHTQRRCYSALRQAFPVAPDVIAVVQCHRKSGHSGDHRGWLRFATGESLVTWKRED